MEIKKNPKVDLGRSSLLFFQIGLILVLAATYVMMEWKTYDNEGFDFFQIEVPDQYQEDVPITQLNAPPPPPPPPPPASPEVVEIIQDEMEVEEDIIESTESSQDEKIENIAEVADITFEEEEEVIEEVPFILVEKIPVYPGCENVKGKEDQKLCMTEKIEALVRREFNTTLGAEYGLSGLQRIFVVFKINENGEVADIQTRAPHKKLEEEAERVVKLIPKMEPGRQRDRPVAVRYSLPILFEIRSLDL